jgi:peroxiredoxin
MRNLKWWRRKQMNAHSFRLSLSTAVLIVITAISAGAADAPSNPSALVGVHERKPAPNFVLKDAFGKTATLKQYQGRIVVLDFWATWCTGCKKEIPWFSEYQKRYGARGLRIVGVAMDDGGWNVAKPFLRDTRVPYRMLLGTEATATKYEIQSLPDTFLIDRHGRIAAMYRARLVDRKELETSIEAVLSEK